MSDPETSLAEFSARMNRLRAKVTQILGNRPSDVFGAIERALSVQYSAAIARDIAFHLLDWSEDAAFLMAIQLFPERFTDEEILNGTIQLLIHAPNHLAAAATLSGNPVSDIFGMGSPTETDD